MAIGVLFEFPGVTQSQYDDTLKQLKPDGKFSKLADWPVGGVLAHVVGPSPSGWRVLDVWESEAALSKFAAVLMPILKANGFPDIPPQIFPVHNFIKA